MMTSKHEYTVRGLRLEADGVLSVELVPADGTAPPPWRAGAHVDLVLGDLGSRQYSLCGPAGADALRVAVLREPAGRGGSAWVHDTLRPGHVLEIGGPRNHFELRAAPAYLFVAGGIGITPLLPMLAEAEASGADWALHYYGRSRARMAFRRDLEPYGDRVTLHPADEGPRADVDVLVKGAAPDALVYACGPLRLLDAVRAAAGAHGVEDRLLTELFAAPADDEEREEGAFTVHLEHTGLTLAVPADRSALDVVAEAGVEVLSDCREGICGSCETRVLAGEVDHRDHILTAQERAAHDCMMLCVSRAAGERLVLDL
jgi:ferredoxin-NADP reductase